MNMKNGDKPAYPVHGGNGDDPRNQIIQGGLTKREMFAMAAMQGILACPNQLLMGDQRTDSSPKMVASAAIKYADELLKQLEL